MSNSSQQFSSWLASSSWWIALSIAGLLLLSVLLLLLCGGRKSPAKKKIAPSVYFEALGGADNVLDKRLSGSRIVLKLKDAQKVDQEKLKEAGVDGFILMSTQVTLVIKGDAEKVYFTLFGEKASRA